MKEEYAQFAAKVDCIASEWIDTEVHKRGNLLSSHICFINI